MVPSPPTFDAEGALQRQGYRLIAGVDEVGRGPLAGPVMAAAVILPLDRELSWLSLVRDSKELTPQRREPLARSIESDALAVGIGRASAEVIDTDGIVAATHEAMRLAIERLSCRPDFVLIDGMSLPQLDCPAKAIVDGDSLCLSIAAASIVAKVARDRLMVEMDRLYPGYGFARHKGYGTPEHLQSLERYGVCPIHRKSFYPVRELIR